MMLAGVKEGDGRFSGHFMLLLSAKQMDVIDNDGQGLLVLTLFHAAMKSV